MARSHGGNGIPRRPFATTIFAWQLLFLGSGVSFCLNQVAQGADERRTVETQRREFSISVDGLKHGSLTMQIQRRSDGTIRVRNEADLHIHILAYKYAYTSSGSEIWKDGHLLAMDNVSDYNGTRYAVKALRTGKSLQVSVDGVSSHLPPDSWLTSYWQSPERLASGELADRTSGDASVVPQDGRGERYLSILDSDQGRKYRGKLVRVGEETLTVAGEQKNCTHYRIKGDDVHVELWYDASGRLVRQDSIESRHRVRFELSEIAAE